MKWLARVDWRLCALAAGAVLALLGMEIATESDGVTPLELLLEVTELLLTIGAAVAVALLFGRMQAQHRERIALTRDLLSARHDGEHWRRQVQSHLDGLGIAIRRQFREWRLTDAESEVCLLLMKGLSHREIGVIRGTSETTVRQQARSAYEKSGLRGRAPLCAYFLEDLLPASEHGRPAGPTSQGEPSADVQRAHGHGDGVMGTP